jgi:hypothetical protein
METIFTWDTANFLWNNNPYTWDEVILVQELAKARAAGDDYMGIFRESPEKKKKFVKILCKVQGTNYEENKEVKDISICIQDVDLVVNKVLGVNLDVKI